MPGSYVVQWGQGLNGMKFDLDEIRAVFFRCKECRTAVSVPRIRWASLPEQCPNCGASWMREPPSSLPFSEDSVIRAFQAASSFRNALQALMSLARSARFTIGMEADGGSESRNDCEETPVRVSPAVSAKEVPSA